MPKVAVLVGALLILQGIVFYLGTGTKSVTALIPAFVGAPMLILGLLGFRPGLRKHAMHGAAVFALLGLVAAVGRIASAGIRASSAGASIGLLILICGAFLILAVRSFVNARRQRQA